MEQNAAQLPWALPKIALLLTGINVVCLHFVFVY